MKVLWTLGLILFILFSILACGFAFFSGFVYGMICLGICLYITILINNTVNRLNNPKVIETEIVEIVSTLHINKLEINQSSGMLGIKTALGFSVALFILGIFVLIIYKITPIYGTLSLIFLVLLIAFSYNKQEELKGNVDFIDIENNDLYIIVSGIFNRKYSIKHIKSFESIHVVYTPPQGKYSPAFFEIFLDGEGDQTLLLKTGLRKTMNKIVENLKDIYQIQWRYSINGYIPQDQEILLFDKKYKYFITPSSYLILFIAFLALAGIFFLFHNYYGFLYLIVSFLNLMYYKKSKKCMELIKLEYK